MEVIVRKLTKECFKYKTLEEFYKNIIPEIFPAGNVGDVFTSKKTEQKIRDMLAKPLKRKGFTQRKIEVEVAWYMLDLGPSSYLEHLILDDVIIYVRRGVK